VPQRTQNGSKPCFVGYVLNEGALKHNSKILHDGRLPVLLDLDLTLIHAMF